jgi:hypothetical protein
MSKPPGLAFRLHGNSIVMGVTRSSRAQDAVFRAVEEALLEGWSVEDFRREARECWSLVLRERAEADEKEWDRV